MNDQQKFLSGVQFVLTGSGSPRNDPAFLKGVEVTKAYLKEGEELGLTLQDYCEVALAELAEQTLN